MGAMPAVAHAEQGYARMLAAREHAGDRERAIELGRRALDRYQSLGMDVYAAEAAAVIPAPEA
jgi:hypothetical protein